jgi:hypothetical protein
MGAPENRQDQEVPRLVKPRLVNGQFPPGASLIGDFPARGY